MPHRTLQTTAVESRRSKTAGLRRALPAEIAEDRVERYARWQETVAVLAQIALASNDLDDLMRQTARRLADALRVDYVAILELGQEKKILTLRAGHGWQKGVVGTAQLNASDQSQAGFTILANEPVLLTGLGADKRFAGEPLLKRHGVVSGITLTIGGQSNRYGVLGIYCKHKREFAPDEVRFLRTIASVLATAVRGHEAAQAQRDSEARVRAIVNTLVDGIITIDEHGMVESINPAAEAIFGYSAGDIVGTNVNRLMPQPYHSEHDRYLENYLSTGVARIIGIGREVSGQRRDGTTFPMDLAVSELEVRGKRMFTGVVRDITQRRRMEREVLEAAADEQRRIGQDLHDGLCQQLAGISFATEVLRQKLAARSAPEAESISKVGKMIDDAITQARDLARGLQPVLLDANGLASALKELTDKIEDMFHITCLFVCDHACPVYDNNVATHLFRIAQEAISNAVKHGRARTVIVDLFRSGDDIALSVKDDGIGLKKNGGKGRGMGLRTMDYRARVIGGTLRIDRGTSGGTVIACRVRNQPQKSGSRRGNRAGGNGAAG